MVKKKTSKKAKAPRNKPVAEPIDPSLEELRAECGMAVTQDRSGGGKGPKFKIEQELFQAELIDAVVSPRTIKETGKIVNVIKFTFQGLEGDNKDLTHVKEIWLQRDNRDTKAAKEDPMRAYSTAKTDIEILGGVWDPDEWTDPVVDIGMQLTAIKNVIAIVSVWKQNEFWNFSIKDRVENDGDGDGDVVEDPKIDPNPAWAEEDIVALSEDDKDQLAKDRGIDPDEYETYALLDVKLIELYC